MQNIIGRHHKSFIRVFRLVWLAVCFVPLAAQTPESALQLEPGQPQERELAVGQSHHYKIHLQAGQCARIEVEQRGINVLLTTFAPDEKYLFWFDREWGTTGIERIVLVAATSGAYQVRIEPRGNAKNIPPGKYVVKLAALQPATEPEQRAFQAHILFAWAKQRGYSDDEKVKAEGIQQAQEWLRLYRHDGDTDASYEMLRLLGAHATAQRNFMQSADYHQQLIALTQATGDQRRLGYILQDISFQYHLVREYQTAVNYKVQELAIWQRLEDRALQGGAWNMLGLQYLRLRQVEKSLDAYAQRLAIVRELQDSTQEAETLQNIANVYGWMEESAKSLEYVMQALRVAEKAGAKRTQASILAELPDRIAFTEGLLSAMQVIKTDPVRRQEFLAMYEKSRALFQELNDPFEAEPLSMLAIWQAHNGQREAALASAEHALQLSQAMTQLPRNGLKATIANVYSLLGESDKAIALQEEAVCDFNGDFDGSANLLRGLAHLLSKAGRLAEARARIEEAIRIKESLRARLSDQEHRTNVSTDLAQAYSFYADLLMQMYEQRPAALLLEEAFLATERARARSLLDLLVEARANIRSEVDPALLARETTLQQKLNSLTPRPNDSRKDQLLEANQQAINTTLDELRNVRAQIRQTNPRFAELTAPQPPTVREIQTQLLDADTLLLAYSLGDMRSFVWAISSDAMHSYPLPSREEITKATRRVYDLLTTPQRLSKLTPAQQQKQLKEAEPQYQTEAARLSQMLLGPVAHQLGNKRLLIIAPEALQYLPFGALPDPVAGENAKASQPPATSHQPLIKDHEIINLPSVSVMMLLRNELGQRKPAPKAVAVLADPVFDVNDSRVKNSAMAKAETTPANSSSSALARSLRSFEGREGLARLMLSRDEAEAIAATVPKNARLKALDFKASRAAAMNAELSQYRIVHFATHGLLNAERPELSGLVFSLVDEKGNAQDGFLRLHEIYNLKLPADLVVLSACQSGLGKDIKGEGMIGLTRGFMYAGAARVVASLWRVDDYATSVLMKKFYRGMLQEKLPAAAALRKAQIEMWRQKQWQSPFYWGAFVLQGEWR